MLACIFFARRVFNAVHCMAKSGTTKLVSPGVQEASARTLVVLDVYGWSDQFNVK